VPTCLIIGSGPGLGEAIALAFGKRGYRVGLIARSEAKLQMQADRLLQEGISVDWAAADAGDGASLEKAINGLVASLGPCGVMIYNAAVMQPGSPLDMTDERLMADFRVNVLGAQLAARLVAPFMIEQGKGAILFTGGGLALEPYPEWSSLALGKAALRSLGLSLFKELHPKGVHVAVLAICGIVAQDGPFDPAVIAEEYWRVATAPKGLADREVIFQPKGTDPYYNDPQKLHAATTLPPAHVSNNAL
jgi:short-subunit dehydrogenase